MNLTLLERERLAWIAGNRELSDALGACLGLGELESVVNCEPEAGFPSEDCLLGIKLALDAVKVSAPVRRALEQAIDSVQLELSRAGEYGADELAKMRTAIEAALPC